MKFKSNNLYRPKRSLILVKGDGAFNFIQNIFTNDLRKLELNSLQYSLLLTPQGKVLYDFYIFKQNGCYFLEVNSNYLNIILALLKKYRLRSLVDFDNCQEYHVVLSEVKIATLSFFDPRCKNLGFRNYLIKSELKKLNKTDNQNNYTKKRLQYLIPEHGEDFQPGKFFAMDLEMSRLNAISFDKGCFIGQEVAARMYYRAKNKKIINVIRCQSSLEINGDTIYESGKKIGKILNRYGEEIMINQLDDATHEL